MKKLTSVRNITNPYAKRILSNVLHKDSLKVFGATPGVLQRLTKGLADKELRITTPEREW